MASLREFLGKLGGGVATTAMGAAEGMATGGAPGALLGAIKGLAAKYIPDPAAQQAFQLELEQIEVQEDTLAQQDRVSARQMQMQVKSILPPIMAIGVILSSLTAEGWILTHGIPSSVDPVIVGRVLGTLDSALMLILSYYFGSSAGSDRKTEILADATKGKK